MADNGTVVIRVRPETFDDEAFPLGVIRLDREKSITFLNRALGAMLGDELRLGMQVTDLPLDAKSRVALDAAMHARFKQHRGSGYDVVVPSPELGTVARLRVAAVPEFDADGNLCGSIGFVIDQSLDQATTAIYKEMEQATDPTRLLCELARVLREVLPFDSFMVTAISEDKEHLRALFETPAPPPSSSPFRWWPMPEFVKKMLRDLVPGPFDLDTLYEDPDYELMSRTNKPAQDFRERDFQPSLRLNVRSKGMQVAVISLLRKRGQPAFTDADLRTCRRLPVVEAVAWAMALEEQLQHAFASDLIQKVTAVGDNAMAVAQCLVDELWEHFKWEHVSLFRVAEDRGRVRLVCQATKAERKLRAGYEESITRGLLGLCVRTGETVRVGNVRKDEDYVVGVEDINSELVVPLPGKPIRWLLNIESSLLDAFAEEEQHAVEMLLRVTSIVLERTAMLELRTAIMDTVADAIIQTNELNTIRDVNVACTRLLDRTRDELIGRDLTSFLAVADRLGSAGSGKDEGTHEPWAAAPTGVAEVDERACNLIRSDARASEVVAFTRRDGSTISMLLSTATVPGEFGVKVFIASDLSGKQYLDRVGRLMPIFRQLASEIRVPLALATTFLEDSSADTGLEQESRDLLDKARSQIRKADVSVEQVMRAAGAADGGSLARSSFDLARVAAHIERHLPGEKRRTLRVRFDGTTPIFVSAAYRELLLCVDSLVSHLLRVQSQGETIDVEAGRADDGKRAFMAFHLSRPDASSPDVGLEAGPRTAGAMVQIAAVVPCLMERMKGEYVAPTAARHEFRLVLPLAG